MSTISKPGIMRTQWHKRQNSVDPDAKKNLDMQPETHQPPGKAERRMQKKTYWGGNAKHFDDEVPSREGPLIGSSNYLPQDNRIYRLTFTRGTGNHTRSASVSGHSDFKTTVTTSLRR